MSARFAAALLLLVPSLARAGGVEAGQAGAQAAQRGVLRVCFLEDDLPRAHRESGRGFDLELMAEVAADAGVPLQPVWSESRAGFSEIESSDLPLGRLARGECDAVGSVPGVETLGRWSDRVALSRPYYGAAFELVAPASAPARLETFAGRKVAVQLQSFGHLAAQALALDWRARPTPREALELYDAGAVEAALVWGPALGVLGRAPHPGWEPPRALRWNEHVAVRAGSEWLAVVERSLERLAAAGEIERRARAHGIPAREPFATTSDREALDELRAVKRSAQR